MAENKPELITRLSKNVTQKLLMRSVAKVPFLGAGFLGLIFGKFLEAIVSRVVVEMEELRAQMLIDRQVDGEVEAVQEAQKNMESISEDSTLEETKKADKDAIDSYRKLFNA